MVLVSVVIPAVSWDGLLEHTLETVARQVLPAGVEVETVVALAGPPPTSMPLRTRTVPNPGRSIPAGLNSAIRESVGEIVVRVDARCDLPSNYVERMVEALRDEKLGAVGCAQLVLDRGLFGSAYSVAFNSPLLGPSAYRYRPTSGLIDSAYLGAWRRADLDQLGGFDPRLLRNQDNELADRFRAAGWCVWYDASSVVGYWNSRDLRSSMAHHRDFGAWRMVQYGQGQRALTVRHLTALSVAAVGASLAFGALVSPRTRTLAIGLGAASYVGAAIASVSLAQKVRRRRPDIETAPLNAIGVALAPAVALLINSAWVAGLIRGALRPGVVGRCAQGPSSRIEDCANADANASSHAASTEIHEDSSAS